jgi:hypothetical protein
MVVMVASACSPGGGRCSVDADCGKGLICREDTHRPGVSVCTHTCTMQSQCFDVSDCVMCDLKSGAELLCRYESSNC